MGLSYKMVPGKLENGAQHAMKWRPISQKMVSNVVLRSLIAGYLYLSFSQFELYLSLLLWVILKSLAQTCCKCCNLSFALCWMCDSLRTWCGWWTTKPIYICGVNKQKYNEHDVQCLWLMTATVWSFVHQRWSPSSLTVGCPGGLWIFNRMRISKNCFQTGSGYR